MPYYSKNQLATMYYPDIDPRTAANNFRRELAETPGLLEALAATGYQKHQRLLTPKQVGLIYEFLGEP